SNDRGAHGHEQLCPGCRHSGTARTGDEFRWHGIMLADRALQVRLGLLAASQRPCPPRARLGRSRAVTHGPLRDNLNGPPTGAAACQAAAVTTFASRGMYSTEVQQRPRITALDGGHQQPDLAGMTDECPGPPVVRGEEARYQPVPAVPERWASEVGNESRTRPSSSNHR